MPNTNYIIINANLCRVIIVIRRIKLGRTVQFYCRNESGSNHQIVCFLSNDFYEQNNNNNQLDSAFILVVHASNTNK